MRLKDFLSALQMPVNINLRNEYNNEIIRVVKSDSALLYNYFNCDINKWWICNTTRPDFPNIYILISDTADRTIKHADGSYFYACPVCDRCFNTSNEMDECINKHLIVLENLGYI